MRPDADELAGASIRAWELLVRALPGAWACRAGGVLGVMTGVALAGFNGVRGEARAVDVSAVGRLLGAVRDAGVPYCLQLRAGWPSGIDDIARAHGLVRVAGEPLMVLGDGSRLETGSRLGDFLHVDGLSVRRLEPEEAGLHARVAAGGQVVGREAPYRAVSSPGVLATAGIRCYVGEVHGAPVTTAMSVTTGDYVGIFSVATLPEHRRRGYGAAVTARAVGDAFEAGAQWAWLSASDAGYHVYESIGFVTIERLDFWEPRRRRAGGG